MIKNESALAASLVPAMLDILKSMPDHSKVSMTQLIEDIGLDITQMNMLELFSVHNKLVQEAEKSGIILDYSEYDGEDVGLPFNLQATVVRNSKKSKGKAKPR